MNIFRQFRSVTTAVAVILLIALVAACGDEVIRTEDATPEAGAATPIADTTDDVTPEATETPEVGTPEPNETPDAEATPDESDAELTPTPDADGETVRIDGGDPLMGKEITEAERDGGTLIEGWTSDLQTVNPVLLNDVPTFEFLSLIFQSLVEADPETLEPVGRLAEAWEVSADGLAWTFYLRDGVTWHDGEPFSADDVQFTYELHFDPETGSSYTADLTSKIESVEVVDDLTVRFHLVNPFADFAVDTAVYEIIPKHIWEDVAANEVARDPGSTGEDPSRVIGTGPFQFQQWLADETATAERYEDYWGGRPHLDQVVFKVVPDQSVAIQQLRTGEIHWLAGVPPESVERLQEYNVAVFDYATLGFNFYATNLDPDRSTLFQDVEVRHAMLHALDREAMVESISRGYGEVAIGTMPSLSWAYNPEGIELAYPYDPELAEQLLEDAGWSLGPDGVREKDGERLSFAMYGDAGDLKVAEHLSVMQEYWREVGIEMRPELVEFQTLIDIIFSYEFDALLVGITWGVSPDQWPMWGCDAYEGGFNIVRYCNEDVDRLLAEANAEPDQGRRVELYTEFQNVLLEDLPMAVLEFPRGISAVSNRVHNVFPGDVNQRFNAETWWMEE